MTNKLNNLGTTECGDKELVIVGYGDKKISRSKLKLYTIDGESWTTALGDGSDVSAVYAVEKTDFEDYNKRQESFDLKLTVEEAQVIYDIFIHVGGCPSQSRRKLSSSVLNKIRLQKRVLEGDCSDDITGGIDFERI